MKIAVLGSGNGGCAVAFDCASHGHAVRLFDFEAFPHNIRGIQNNGGIYATGEMTGYAPVEYAGHQIEKALHEAQVIFVVGPAYSTKPFAKACQPHLRKGQTVIVCPGSCGGSIVFKQGAGLAIRDEKITVAETSTLPYAVRLMEPGKIRVFLKLKGGLFLAAVPASNTPQVMRKIQDVYPAMKAAKNVLQTSLQNGNPVIHPAVTLLNAALVERTGGDFFFYEDGVTPAVGRLIKAIDMERVAIGKELGIEVIPDPELGCLQGYMVEPTYTRGYAKAPGFKGIKAQDSLDYRYFREDVGYGLVFMQKLGEQVGVDTPYISAIVRLASLIMDRDYLGEGKRTMASLGLAALSTTELDRILD
jgi:opine dehydrogenase